MPDEAYAAACEAVELDSSSAARALIVAARGRSRSVAWRGLSDVQQARTVTGKPAYPDSRPFDLGHGVVAYHGEAGGIIAVDLFTRTCLWESSTLSPLADGLWLDQEARICRIDPLTGTTTEVIGSHRWRSLRRTETFALGDHTFGNLVERRRSEDYGSEQPSDFEIAMFDLATGDRCGRINHTGDRVGIWPIGEWLAVELDGELGLYDRTGRYRWSRPGPGYVIGVVDNRLFLGGVRVTVLDLKTGEQVVEIDEPGRSLHVTETSVVLSTPRRVTAFDRKTLERSWQRDFATDLTIVATANAVLVVTDRRTSSLSLATGVELSSVDVGPAARDSSLLAAGKLVMLWFAGDAPVVIVD